jgi:hypothetical protein
VSEQCFLGLVVVVGGFFRANDLGIDTEMKIAGSNPEFFFSLFQDAIPTVGERLGLNRVCTIIVGGLELSCRYLKGL